MKGRQLSVYTSSLEYGIMIQEFCKSKGFAIQFNGVVEVHSGLVLQYNIEHRFRYDSTFFEELEKFIKKD